MSRTSQHYLTQLAALLASTHVLVVSVPSTAGEVKISDVAQAVTLLQKKYAACEFTPMFFSRIYGGGGASVQEALVVVVSIEGCNGANNNVGIISLFTTGKVVSELPSLPFNFNALSSFASSTNAVKVSGTNRWEDPMVERTITIKLRDGKGVITQITERALKE